MVTKRRREPPSVDRRYHSRPRLLHTDLRTRDRRRGHWPPLGNSSHRIHSGRLLENSGKSQDTLHRLHQCSQDPDQCRHFRNRNQRVPNMRTSSANMSTVNVLSSQLLSTAGLTAVITFGAVVLSLAVHCTGSRDTHTHRTEPLLVSPCGSSNASGRLWQPRLFPDELPPPAHSHSGSRYHRIHFSRLHLRTHCNYRSRVVAVLMREVC